MKETYSRPTVTNADIESNSTGWVPAAAMLAGYAAARVVTNAIKAAPSIKLPSLTRGNHDI